MFELQDKTTLSPADIPEAAFATLLRMKLVLVQYHGVGKEPCGIGGIFALDSRFVELRLLKAST